jgi:hypothetical protein
MHRKEASKVGKGGLERTLASYSTDFSIPFSKNFSCITDKLALNGRN